MRKNAEFSGKKLVHFLFERGSEIFSSWIESSQSAELKYKFSGEIGHLLELWWTFEN
jgi:hypothetical protein